MAKCVGYVVEVPEERIKALILGLVLYHGDEGGISAQEIFRRIEAAVGPDAKLAFQVVAGALALGEEPPRKVGVVDIRPVDAEEAERLQQELAKS